MQKKFGALTSSQDPEQIATKVKGIILAASSIIIFLAAHFFGITLNANDIISLSTEISGIVGLTVAIYGSVLHVIAWAYSVRQP